MSRQRGILRVLGKAALWASVALLSVAALWFAANRLLDEAPEVDRHVFLVSAADQLADERNIAIGILGLTAPSGENFVQYGAKVNSLYRAGAPWPDIQEMVPTQERVNDR